DAPKYVDTVPGKGYRFIAPVVEGPDVVAGASISDRAQRVAPTEAPPPRARFRAGLAEALSLGAARKWGLVAAIALALAALAGLSVWARHHTAAALSEVTLAVLPFDNLSGDPEAEYL